VSPSDTRVRESIGRLIDVGRVRLLNRARGASQSLEKATARYPPIHTLVIIILCLCAPPTLVFLAFAIPSTLLLLVSTVAAFALLEGLLLGISGAILVGFLLTICSVCVASFCIFATAHLLYKYSMGAAGGPPTKQADTSEVTSLKGKQT